MRCVSHGLHEAIGGWIGQWYHSKWEADVWNFGAAAVAGIILDVHVQEVVIRDEARVAGPPRRPAAAAAATAATAAAAAAAAAAAIATTAATAVAVARLDRCRRWCGAGTH